MEALPEFKARAIKLRKRGLSYNEIRKQIPVAKSTLSLWLKDVPLKEEHRQKLYSKKIHYLSYGSQSQKERRLREVDEIVKKAKDEIQLPISMESYRLCGATLYWAEGSKGRGLEITNSDPYLILFMVNWFKKIFDIDPTSLKVHLNIHAEQNEMEIKKFWSNLCNIPLKNFCKTFIKPKSKGYKKNNLYYGTIKIRVLKSTDMRIRIFGWIQKMLEEGNPDIAKLQRKWENLKKVPPSVNIISMHPKDA